MSRNDVFTVALALALAFGSAGLAVAQQDMEPAAAAQTEEGFDWGWLGLIGLLGLAGLAGSRRRQEPGRTTTTGTVR